VDNDCDGKIDNVPGTSDRLTRPCSAQCGDGLQTCITPAGGNYEKWSACDVPAPQKEVCDGKDNDCDGEVDENLSLDCSNCRGAGSLDCVDGKMTECSAPQVLSITDCSDPVEPLNEQVKDIDDVPKRRGTIIDGCGCGTSSSSASGYLVVAAVLFVLARRRRRA
jgi:MYXO-CTERM domain-containing protein